MFRLWNTAQMTTRPTTTGSEPRSPLRSLLVNADTAPLRPREAMSRSSWRSAGSSDGSSSLTAAGPRPGPVSDGVLTRSPPAVRRAAALRDGVVRRPGDRGDDVLELVWLTWKTPLLRPSRSTTTRSATAMTSAMLWLMRITPRPRSRSRSTRLSTSAVWATPRAAVGSSRMTTLGSPSSERAIATVCRWPPDRLATGMRTEGILADSWRSSFQDWRSISTSSRARWCRSSRPRKRLPTTSRLSHSARSWNTVAMPSSWASAGLAMLTGLPSKVI